ncbi:alpha/beta hydrolase [Corynebacterium evansiae]|uniref:Alpha/beta hydrolase family protein n=1 Tax=Corynebacterium evansiae TaxID=2913499 RepID=A0A9X3LLL9_9CORY|nr:alpha/beta hydrolase [Corynebacterium evansiae]MCZ9290427.1 alpha/beta hydrolase family protein [Corynebacterium evansiae]
MISSATSTVTVDALKSAKVEALRSAADLFTRNGDKTSRHAANAREQAKWGADWSGQAADAAGHATDSAANQLDTAGFSSSTIGQLADTHADVLGPTRSVVRTTVGLARGALMSVHQDGEVSARHLALIPGIGEAAQNLALVLTNILRGALQLASVLDRVSGTAISAISGTVAPPRSDVGVGEVEGASSIKGPQNLPPVQRVDTPHGPVVTVGDVEGADEVITLVSGVGSSNADALTRTEAWARATAADAAAHGRNVAVVAWHGYSAPGDLPGAISRAPAQEGATALREHQRQLRERNPDAKLQVVGYSYGSVVVGEAAEKGSEGLAADEVRFWGSPGVHAQHAEDLQLNSQAGHGQVINEHVPGDMIRLATTPGFGVHGKDPASPDFAPNSGSWSSYGWGRILDLYLMSRGETDAHSSYMWSPEVNVQN